MNEVNTTSALGVTTPRAASSKGVIDSKAETEGKKLPEAEKAATTAPVSEVKEPETEAKAKESRESVEAAVASINEYVQSIQRDLHFSVDEESETTVIKVTDSGSGKLIRQIPEEVVLNLARNLNDNGEFHMVNALG